MSTDRINPKKGFVDPKDLPKGPNGFALCRWCNTEVKPPKKTFCSPGCVHEWKLRSSPKYVRQCLKKRDKGVCAECGIDTYEFSKGLRWPLAGETREDWQARCKVVREEWKISPTRKTLWDYEHQVPVCEGGGYKCADILANAVTLCVICHRKRTAKLATKRAAERKAKKNALKAI